MNNKIKSFIAAAGLAVAVIGSTAATAAPAQAGGGIVVKFKGKFGSKGYYGGYYGYRPYRRHCKPVFRYVFKYGKWRKRFVGWRCFPRYGYGYGYGYGY